MEHHNLLESLAYHAKTDPNKNALYLLNNNDINIIDQQINYHDLLLKTYHLAEKLKECTNTGDRIILCYPTGLDFVIAFYACLLAKVIAVAVTVPSNQGLLNKYNAICNDCTPALILTDSKTTDHYFQSTCNIKLIATDELIPLDLIDIHSIQLPEIEPNDLAFLQYTSGSTAAPKGVMISHGNLMDNINKMTLAFKGTKDSIGLKWIPHTHDMGLIGSFLHSIHKGAEIYLMSPLSFIRRPMSWLKALSKYKVEITGCPCFGLKMCLDHLTQEEAKQLNLSHLRYIIVGSEPIVSQVVIDFFNQLQVAALSPNSFAPSYGLAESTLMVSSRTGLYLNNNNMVSCGTTYQTVKIIQAGTNTCCADGETGEIWLHGASVAQGYWGNSSESMQNFNAQIENDARLFYKTGDLGFLYQNELYITGRLKDLIIIHGLNYYPQDIEELVLSCDDRLKSASCAVFRWFNPTQSAESFVVLVRSNKKLSDETQQDLIIQIKKQILKMFQLIPHDIQFIKFSIPRTTSGKIQRNMCEQYYKEQCIAAG